MISQKTLTTSSIWANKLNGIYFSFDLRWCRNVGIHTDWNAWAPLAILETFEHFCAFYFESIVAWERYAFANGIVELHRGHSTADCCARIWACSSALKNRKIFRIEDNFTSKINSHFGTGPLHRPLSWHAMIGCPCIMYSGLQLNWTTSPALYGACPCVYPFAGVPGWKHCTSEHDGNGPPHSPVGRQTASDVPRRP